MKSLDLWPRVFWSACALLSYRKMDRLIVSTIASTYQQRDHFDRDSLHAVLYAALLQAAVQAVNRVPRGELRGNRRQTVNKQCTVETSAAAHWDAIGSCVRVRAALPGNKARWNHAARLTGCNFTIYSSASSGFRARRCESDGDNEAKKCIKWIKIRACQKTTPVWLHCAHFQPHTKPTWPN